MEEGPGVRACSVEGGGCLCPRFGVREAGRRGLFQDYISPGAGSHRRGILEDQKDSVIPARNSGSSIQGTLNTPFMNGVPYKMTCHFCNPPEAERRESRFKADSGQAGMTEKL